MVPCIFIYRLAFTVDHQTIKILIINTSMDVNGSSVDMVIVLSTVTPTSVEKPIDGSVYLEANTVVSDLAFHKVSLFDFHFIVFYRTGRRAN